ncbi:MAG: flagellar basal body L-ring protein FlgH [Gammaproteobacteria bacterium]|nr:flagellar basal body L-ring protein FlgH [Gammaproteobacteria bacterium]
MHATNTNNSSGGRPCGPARQLASLLLALLAGCDASMPPRHDTAYAPSFAAPPLSSHQASTGAIYQQGHDLSLYEDLRPRRIGDIITVRLVESTNASKSASSSASRSQGTSISNPTLFGATPQFDLPGVMPLSSRRDNTLEMALEGSNEFEGESGAAQGNSLQGQITVTVADVLPNGVLFVRGEKRINLNQGNEYIKVSGLIRPADIATDNSVLSTKLADATIVYNGDGAPADANRMGWLGRFFLSPIFPF